MSLNSYFAKLYYTNDLSALVFFFTSSDLLAPNIVKVFPAPV